MSLSLCVCVQEESCQPTCCCVGSLMLLLFFLALTIIGIALVEFLFGDIGVTSRFMPNALNMTRSSCEEMPDGEVYLAQSACIAGIYAFSVWVMYFTVIAAIAMDRILYSDFIMYEHTYVYG